MVQETVAGLKIYIDKGYRNLIKRSPYVVGFYLSNNYVTKNPDSQYIISTNNNYNHNNLALNNDFIYFKASKTIQLKNLIIINQN